MKCGRSRSEDKLDVLGGNNAADAHVADISVTYRAFVCVAPYVSVSPPGNINLWPSFGLLMWTFMAASLCK